MTSLTHLKGLLERATKGPWYANPDGNGEEGDWCIYFDEEEVGRVEIIQGTCFWNNEDAALIVAAVNSLPGLLEELEAVRKVEEAAREVVSREIAYQCAMDGGAGSATLDALCNAVHDAVADLRKAREPIIALRQKEAGK